MQPVHAPQPQHPETTDARASEDVAAEPPTDAAIAARAFEIHLSGDGGTDVDDWLRAEHELTNNG